MKIAHLDSSTQFKDCRSPRFYLAGLVLLVAAILLGFSSLQLWLFRAGNDLGFFDQLVYLLSQGKAPISTLLPGVHLIGDHGAIIFYPLALLYVIYPSIYWLLVVQAIALASGAIPLYLLSRDRGLNLAFCRAIALCYVLYPAIFNINFYTEFRPETLAVPALLWAVLAVNRESPRQFVLAIAIVLSCKETMALTVVGLGIWLILGEKRLRYGLSCILAGVAWFGFAAVYLIPRFRGGYQMAGTWHYESLGTSLPEIAFKVLTHPQIFSSRALTGDRLFYYLLLISPLILGLHWRKIGALVPALPMLGLNILADFPRQRDLIHQYSLPIIPFLFLWLVASVVYLTRHQQRRWLNPRLLVIWSIIAWLALAKYGYFWTRYAPLYDNVAAVRGAVNLVQPDAKVLTSGYIAPHLSQRSHLRLLNNEIEVQELENNALDTVLIAQQHLGVDTSQERANQIIQELLKSSRFDLVYQQQDVWLWRKND